MARMVACFGGKQGTEKLLHAARTSDGEDEYYAVKKRFC
jgi:hypothetical protein